MGAINLRADGHDGSPVDDSRTEMCCHHAHDALASYMRTTVDIDAHLLKRLRDEAHARGISFKELLNGVVRRGLEAPPPSGEPYTCPTFAMGSPRVSLDKALSLADAHEDEEIARKLTLRK